MLDRAEWERLRIVRLSAETGIEPALIQSLEQWRDHGPAHVAEQRERGQRPPARRGRDAAPYEVRNALILMAIEQLKGRGLSYRRAYTSVAELFPMMEPNGVRFAAEAVYKKRRPNRR